MVVYRRGAGPGMLVMMVSHCGPLLAAADPEEVPEGSGEVIDKVCQEGIRVTLIPGKIRGRDSHSCGQETQGHHLHQRHSSDTSTGLKHGTLTILCHMKFLRSKF